MIEYWLFYHEGLFSSICKIFAIKEDNKYPRDEKKKEPEVNQGAQCTSALSEHLLKANLKDGVTARRGLEGRGSLCGEVVNEKFPLEMLIKRWP